MTTAKSCVVSCQHEYRRAAARRGISSPTSNIDHPTSRRPTSNISHLTSPSLPPSSHHFFHLPEVEWLREDREPGLGEAGRVGLVGGGVASDERDVGSEARVARGDPLLQIEATFG